MFYIPPFKNGFQGFRIVIQCTKQDSFLQQKINMSIYIELIIYSNLKKVDVTYFVLFGLFALLQRMT